MHRPCCTGAAEADQSGQLWPRREGSECAQEYTRCSCCRTGGSCSSAERYTGASDRCTVLVACGGSSRDAEASRDCLPVHVTQVMLYMTKQSRHGFHLRRGDQHRGRSQATATVPSAQLVVPSDVHNRPKRVECPLSQVLLLQACTQFKEMCLCPANATTGDPSAPSAPYSVSWSG